MIGEYVLAGITDVTEIHRLLRLYVNENFSKDVHRGETPKLCDRSLYPQDSDIRNHIHLAKRAVEFSKLDQESLKQKIQQWKTQYPFFRPCKAPTCTECAEQHLDDTMMTRITYHHNKVFFKKNGNRNYLI